MKSLHNEISLINLQEENYLFNTEESLMFAWLMKHSALEHSRQRLWSRRGFSWDELTPTDSVVSGMKWVRHLGVHGLENMTDIILVNKIGRQGTDQGTGSLSVARPRRLRRRCH